MLNVPRLHPPAWAGHVEIRNPRLGSKQESSRRRPVIVAPCGRSMSREITMRAAALFLETHPNESLTSAGFARHNDLKEEIILTLTEVVFFKYTII